MVVFEFTTKNSNQVVSLLVQFCNKNYKYGVCLINHRPQKCYKLYYFEVIMSLGKDLLSHKMLEGVQIGYESVVKVGH